MTELTNLLTSFARDAAWQSTAALAIGLIVARYFVRQPARAHAVLVLTFIAAVAAPAASQLVRHRGWGVLAPEAAATANQPAANRVETATVPAGADEPIAFSAQENRRASNRSMNRARRPAGKRSTALNRNEWMASTSGLAPRPWGKRPRRSPRSTRAANQLARASRRGRPGCSRRPGWRPACWWACGWARRMGRYPPGARGAALLRGGRGRGTWSSASPPRPRAPGDWCLRVGRGPLPGDLVLGQASAGVAACRGGASLDGGAVDGRIVPRAGALQAPRSLGRAGGRTGLLPTPLATSMPSRPMCGDSSLEALVKL